MGLNLVSVAKKLGIKKVLNLGSSCMYPKNFEEAIPEKALLTGELEETNEGYAIAKIAVAKACEYISRENSNYFYKTIIPCNLYGKYDKFDDNSSHMIPAVIKKSIMRKLIMSQRSKFGGMVIRAVSLCMQKI